MSDLVAKYEREAEERNKEWEERVKKYRAGSEERERKAAERKIEHEKEMVILRAIEVDSAMLENLTAEELLQYDCPSYKLERLEGNYIEEFERKLREGSIEVNSKFQAYIKKHSAPLLGFDPRTGVYGLKYAAAGFYSAGVAYMEQEKWEEAIANFAKAIELQPRHVAARGYKAVCYHQMGDHLRDRAEIYNAINLNPVTMARYDESTRELLKRVNPEGIAVYTRMLLEHLDIRGTMQILREQWEDALPDFDEIIELDPGNTVAYHRRLMVYNAYSDWDQYEDWDPIIENATRCIEDDYDRVYALEARGRAYRELKRYEEALSDLNEVIAMNAGNDVTFVNRCICYRKMKEYQKALADAEEAIRLGADDGYYYRGQVYREMGE